MSTDLLPFSAAAYGAGIGGLLGFLSAYSMEWAKATSQKEGAAKSLIGSLAETYNYLAERYEDPSALQKEVDEYKKVWTDQLFVQLETASFESAVFSGIVKDFKTETRVEVSKMFQELRLINYLELQFFQTTNLQNLEMLKTPDDVLNRYKENLARYYTVMKEKEIALLDEIPDLIFALRNEIRARFRNFADRSKEG